MKGLRTFIALLIATIPVVATDWYLDNSLVASANNGTNWANAWTNFTSVKWWMPWSPTGIQFGDTLYLSGGATSQTYSGPWNIVTWGAYPGTNGYSTVMCGQDATHNGMVIIDGGGVTNCIEANGCSYLHFDGQVAGDGQRHITLQNAGDPDPVAHLSTGGVAFRGSVSQSLIEYVYVTNCLNGVHMAVGSGDTNIVKHCKIVGIYGNAAVRLGVPNSGNSSAANLLTDSELSMVVTNWSTGYGADGVQMSDGVTVSNCLIYGVLGSLTYNQHQDGIQHLGSNIRVEANTFRNLANSACESTGEDTSHQGCTNITFVNNLVHITDSAVTNGWPRGFEWVPHVGQSAFDGFLIANNTFVDIPRWSAIRFFLGVTTNTAISNVTIQNNIIVNCGFGSLSAIQIDVGPLTDTNTLNIDYNVMALGAAPTSNTNITINGVAWVQTNPRGGTPTFVAYSQYGAANDFELQASDTSARGLGIDLSAYFTEDRNGDTRIGWDIGAYESDYVGPVISAAACVATSASTATASWNTDEAATSRAECSEDTSYTNSVTAAAYVTSHSLGFTSLKAATTYNYRVISADAYGNSTTNTPSTFATWATNAPSVTIGTLQVGTLKPGP